MRPFPTRPPKRTLLFRLREEPGPGGCNCTVGCRVESGGGEISMAIMALSVTPIGTGSTSAGGYVAEAVRVVE